MACMEYHCKNHKCGWYEMNNETVKVCPRCGDEVISYFDEEFDHYSPIGDDDDIPAWDDED